MGQPVSADDLPSGVPVWDLPRDDVRNPVMDRNNASREAGNATLRQRAATHQERMATDPYYATAYEEGPVKNAVYQMGGVMTGLGYIGPRQMLGLDKPGEVDDHMAAVSGSRAAPGGSTGAMAGYAAAGAPAVLLPGANTALGSFVLGNVYGAAEPVSKDGSRARNALQGGLGWLAGNQLGKIAGNQIGGRVADKQAALSKEKALSSVKDQTMREGRELGYVLPPSATGKNSLLESVGGQIKTQQAASWKNQRVTNEIARKDLGLSDTAQLTSKTMEAVRKEAGRAYDDIAQQGPFFSDAIEQVKGLRNEGYKKLTSARTSGDPELMKEAIAMLDDAKQWDDIIEQGLSSQGKQDLVKAYQDARVRIAKAHTYNDAIVNATGDVDAGVLAIDYQMGNRGMGPKLSGGSENIGKFAEGFDQSTRWRSFRPLPNSALDVGVGTLAAANATHPAGLAAMGLPLLRNPARSVVLREAAQNALMNPQYEVSPLMLGLAKALNNPLTQSATGLAGLATMGGYE